MAKPSLRTLRTLVILLALAIFAVILYRWISQERLQFFPPKEAATNSPTPEPTPTRPPPIGSKLEAGRLFNGITLHSSVETTPGADASTERVDPDSYVLDLKLNARVPTPNRTVDELAKITPRLPELLPGLSAMISPESVSPLFGELYNTKVKMLRENLSRLDLLLSRHNFFDCQTVLQLQHPQTKRKALLLQADMDVDCDGSDGDRLPTSLGAPTNFKPFTSFKWTKKNPAAPNPYLPGTEERLKKAEDEFAAKTTNADRKRDLRNAITQLRAEVTTLKKYSFLIGTTDPYIVMPGAFTRGKDAAKTGDYALVVYGDAVYPAIVGDIGPNDKVGEASFRIAKQINTQATPYNRPVSDLKVTYLVFPGTADPQFGPPDLEKLQSTCQKLVDEIGGSSVPLHHWEDIIPKPTPTPTATATVSPSPTSTSSPTGSSSPAASPSATFAFPISSPSSRN